MNPFIGYHFATSNNFPPYSQKLQEYWLAANGLFLRSHRRELEVCLQVTQTQVAGLQPIEPYFRLKVPKVPSLVIADIINAASINPQQEILFYLGVTNYQWWCHTPLQTASSTHVLSLESALDKSYTDGLVEIHSHGTLAAYPSSVDNQEEKGKFRVFAIIGTLNTIPTIYTRIGIYNHFFDINPNHIFELPPQVKCSN
ncbi:MAG: Mov34/MPN/PAD-1 family protein [Nostoc sp. DedVER02]|uniref:Mov34/MPN/PAD-1 family protein n=1 Tax=unclassified Nostoc TaxID=2593658 RepID=UPI002AD4FAFA|nr:MULTISPECIES: Mov34/MPN/PAD-1 family protein [unclassified Nostoc]MDZ7989761.1 Mov34/MPN/PAD-1 family protein [Nostoc sp. DedVER02]MDZ8113315.1 Mov34/MPN/PAD-1 family protein [Nostoc sp. DedVER01b]